MTSDRDTLAELIDAHSFQAPSYSEEAADAVIAAGWRPPAREIEKQADIDALPVGSIVHDAFAAACTRVHPDPVVGWVRATSAVRGGRHCHPPYLPATVLYAPTEEA